MITLQDKKLIEQQLNEKFDSVILLAETRVSSIYVLDGKNKYIFKHSKKKPLNNFFKNQKKIFNMWKKRKDSCDFRVPEPILLGPDGRFMVIEYVKGENLLTKLVKGQNNTESLFYKTGRSLKQYHTLATQAFADTKEHKENCEKIKDLLERTNTSFVANLVSEFPSDCTRALFRDFTPTNIMVSSNDNIFFLDINDIVYLGPFYYDLSRFIDTTKVFCLINNPLSIFTGYHNTKKAIKAFLSGYGEDVNRDLLKKMQFIHRKDHIRFKKETNLFRGLILEILYKII